MIQRIFYAAGPGHIIGSYQHWKRGDHDPTEVALTFSGQILDACRDLGLEAHLVSTHPKKMLLRDGAFTLEHRPKARRRGIAYHLTEIAYGLGLLRSAKRFRADYALLDSGTTHYFVMRLFRLLGIEVVPILHNTLWPTGHRPTGRVARLLHRLDAGFFRRTPAFAVAVSPECARQVERLLGHRPAYDIHQIRAQFRHEFFARIPPPPPHESRPFRIMFIGRIERLKGVFDILEIARTIEERSPGLCRWEICGRGLDFDELARVHQQLHLESVVRLRGWTPLEDLVQVYTESHAAIVPTRSSFTEGLAMSAAEAILAGRPLITNPVVPALEILRPACIETRTDDPDSCVSAVMQLATDADLYARARDACRLHQQPFYDRSFGLTAVLERAWAQRETAAVPDGQAPISGTTPPLRRRRAQ